jgi:hypothetical protein
MQFRLQTTDTLFTSRLIAAGLSVSLVALNVVRIFNVSITHDETGASSGISYRGIMLNESHSSNNHVLHSLLRKLFVDAFGDGLFFLRLDSLLAQFLFLVFTYKLCSLLFRPCWWQLASFLVINIASPLIFQFWGLSRGYGLGIAFISVALYYFLLYLKEQRLAALLYSLGAAILTVYSNFSFIYFFASLPFAVLISTLVAANGNVGRKFFVRELPVLAAGCMVLVALNGIPLMNVLSNDEHFFGHTGFITDTMFSLAKECILLENNGTDGRLIVVYGLLTITGLQFIYWGYAVLRFKRTKSELPLSARWGVGLLVLLVGPALFVILAHAVLNVDYVTDRTAMFFVLLFVVDLMYWLYYISGNRQRTGYVTSGIVLLFCMYNFCSNMNVNRTFMWWYSRDDLALLKRIVREQEGDTNKVRIWLGFYHVPTFRYNTRHYYPGMFDPIPDQYPPLWSDTTYDYCYLDASEAGQVPQNYAVDSTFAGGSMILFKKR